MSQQDIAANNKRILKNSLYLYLRMFLTMAIGVYTTRIVLRTLGEVDFGLYGVVGGLVYMLAFIQSAMMRSTSRFITYAIGEGDENKIKKTFQTTFTVHLVIGILVLIFLESIGLYAFNMLNIPIERYNICMCIYQYSVIYVVLNICAMPLSASVVAHEKMNFYAYLSISDVLLKLFILYAVVYVNLDKLFVYGTLVFITNIINIVLCLIYCKIKFKYIKFKIDFSKEYISSIFRFTGWNFLGNFANLLRLQGVNYLLNIFYGPTVNAARGLAMQVQSIVSRFIQNIHTAINPQITKSYVRNDIEYLKMLIFASSRYSFYIILLIAFPIYIELEYFLQLWLGEYPDYTISFIRILLIGTIFENFMTPLEIAINATEKIKQTQLLVSGLYIILFLLCYVLLKIGLDPNWTFISTIFFNILIIIGRILILRTYIPISLIEYFHAVIQDVFLVLTPCASIYLLYRFMLNISMPLVNAFGGVVIVFIAIWFVGLKKTEKSFITKVILGRIRGKHK